MDSKTSSVVVLVLGALVLLASLTADITGLGDDVGFGPQQKIGTIAGIAILVIGAYLYRKADTGSTSAGQDSGTE